MSQPLGITLRHLQQFGRDVITAKKHKLSGRDIRQLVKLAMLLHLSEGNSIQLKDLEWALKWRDSGQSKKESP